MASRYKARTDSLLSESDIRKEILEARKDKSPRGKLKPSASSSSNGKPPAHANGNSKASPRSSSTLATPRLASDGSLVRPNGTLTVVVVEGKGLAPQDIGGEIAGLKPYCVLSLGEHSEKKTDAGVGRDPTWLDQEFTFNVYDKAFQLDVSVYDRNRVKKDPFLGCVTIDSTHLEASEAFDTWFDLHTRDKDKSHQPKIRLQIEYLDVSALKLKVKQMGDRLKYLEGVYDETVSQYERSISKEKSRVATLHGDLSALEDEKERKLEQIKLEKNLFEEEHTMEKTLLEHQVVEAKLKTVLLRLSSLQQSRAWSSWKTVCATNRVKDESRYVEDELMTARTRMKRLNAEHEDLRRNVNRNRKHMAASKLRSALLFLSKQKFAAAFKRWVEWNQAVSYRKVLAAEKLKAALTHLAKQQMTRAFNKMVKTTLNKSFESRHSSAEREQQLRIQMEKKRLAKQEAGVRMSGVLKRMSHSNLLRAFNKLHQAVVAAQLRKERAMMEERHLSDRRILQNERDHEVQHLRSQLDAERGKHDEVLLTLQRRQEQENAAAGRTKEASAEVTRLKRQLAETKNRHAREKFINVVNRWTKSATFRSFLAWKKSCWDDKYSREKMQKAQLEDLVKKRENDLDAREKELQRIAEEKKRREEEEAARLGTLTISGMSAQDLLAADSFFKGGKSDPFCKCFIVGDGANTKTQETTVIWNNLNPKWDDEIVFDRVPDEATLVIEVFDKDKGSTNDDFLGMVSIPLVPVQSRGHDVFNLDLQARKLTEEVKGIIQGKLAWKPGKNAGQPKKTQHKTGAEAPKDGDIVVCSDCNFPFQYFDGRSEADTETHKFCPFCSRNHEKRPAKPEIREDDTTSAISRASVIDEEVSRGNAQSPKWQDNDEAADCNLCGSDFSLFRRKHHCRHCGQIFCANCTTHQYRIMKYGYNDPVRVCDRCFYSLQSDPSKSQR